MSERSASGTDRDEDVQQAVDHPIDAQFCPSCGDKLPTRAVEMWADELLNRYRVQLQCPHCGYVGEVVRHDGLEEGSA